MFDDFAMGIAIGIVFATAFLGSGAGRHAADEPDRRE
jgi:hypothetical protein